MGKYHKIYNLLKSPIKIPINDIDAWTMYPKYRWVYNKLILAEFQNVNCAPMPIEPNKYPVIIKPIINLYGMGLNVIKVNSRDEFYDNWLNSNFWMEFFEGDHCSFDLITLNGRIQFHTCFLGYKDTKKIGKFDYWESIERSIPPIIIELIDEKFCEYSGCLNVETIGDKIIECHLRMGDIDQFPTFDILKGIIETYQNKKYNWNIEVEKVFFIPVWDKENNDANNTIFDFMSGEIVPLMGKNNHIYDFHIDNCTLATPCDQKRLMWFTCGNIEVGKAIRDEIYKHVNIYYDAIKMMD